MYDVFALALHVMINCISPFILIILKRILLKICLQQIVLLFDKHGVQFPLAMVKFFLFSLLNSILLLPMMLSSIGAF